LNTLSEMQSKETKKIESALKNRFFLYFLVGSLLALLFSLSIAIRSIIPFKYAQLGQTTIVVRNVSTNALRVQGLSGTKSLEANEGMLFDFKQVGQWAMWMKDMHYPLDIIWITSSGKVVYEATNLQPNDYPTIHENTTACRYVLEVNAGIAQANKITVGASIHFR